MKEVSLESVVVTVLLVQPDLVVLLVLLVTTALRYVSQRSQVSADDYISYESTTEDK